MKKACRGSFPTYPKTWHRPIPTHLAYLKIISQTYSARTRKKKQTFPWVSFGFVLEKFLVNYQGRILEITKHCVPVVSVGGERRKCKVWWSKESCVEFKKKLLHFTQAQLFDQICSQRDNMRDTIGDVNDEDVWVACEIKYAETNDAMFGVFRFLKPVTTQYRYIFFNLKVKNRVLQIA